ncbi:MAG: hypothetical protein ACTSRY_05835, partial [Alphaproteobacteria bacterium]
MNPLGKFILILFGLLLLGLGVVFTFRLFGSERPSISLSKLGDEGPARLVMEPLVVAFSDVGGRAVLRNYRVEIE